MFIFTDLVRFQLEFQRHILEKPDPNPNPATKLELDLHPDADPEPEPEATPSAGILLPPPDPLGPSWTKSSAFWPSSYRLFLPCLFLGV